MVRSSIGRELFRSLAYSITFLWCLVILCIGLFSNYETEEIFNNSLQETAQRLLSLAVYEIRKNNQITGETWGEPLPHGEYVTYQVFDQAGNILLRSHQSPLTPFSVPLKQGLYRKESQVFYVESTKDELFHIVLAENPYHRQHTLVGLILSLAIPLGLLLPLSYFLVYSAIKRAKLPLSQFAEEVALRDGRNLTPLAIENVPEEVASLGISVNVLLKRLSSVLTAERHFMSNMAHELKTPLAIALAQFDVVLNLLRDEESQARIQRAKNAILRVEHTSSKLLQLARAESGRALDLTAIDLKNLVQLLLTDLFGMNCQKYRFDTSFDVVWIQGDIDAVGICVLNLLENAQRHSTPDTFINVRIYGSGVLEIENDCLAIPPDQLEQIAQRHVRCSNISTGSGLGLSIVSSIIHQMGGDLTFSSPSRSGNRGFKVSVVFGRTS